MSPAGFRISRRPGAGTRRGFASSPVFLLLLLFIVPLIIWNINLKRFIESSFCCCYLSFMAQTMCLSGSKFKFQPFGMCVYIYIYTHTCIYIYTYICIYIYIYAHIHIHTDMLIITIIMMMMVILMIVHINTCMYSMS